MRCGQNGIPAPEPPDWTPCCFGSAVNGHGGCTCWEPVYDAEQAAPRTGEPAELRRRMCDDCAYRPDSPERADAFSEDALLALPADASVFWCHQGMRRVAAWRHPDGREVPGAAGAYEPPIVAERPYRADGRPAAVCGGWLVRRDAILRESVAGGSEEG